MQRQTNGSGSRPGRRQFLKSAGGAAAGVYLAGAGPRAGAQQTATAAAKETLALHGGPKAVTTPLPPFTRCILAKIPLQHLPERNAAGVAQVKRLKDRLTPLPGLSAPYVRPDCERVYYNRNFLFLDEAKAGLSREACRQALRSEDVHVGVYNGLGNLRHSYPVFQASRGWHHLPAVPAQMPGCEEARRTGLQLPSFTCAAPELVDQYVQAFERVWVHRRQLA